MLETRSFARRGYIAGYVLVSYSNITKCNLKCNLKILMTLKNEKTPVKTGV